MPYYTYTQRNSGSQNANYNNAAFYTTDGMRFEFNIASYTYEMLKLHESDTYACAGTNPWTGTLVSDHTTCNGCGSYGLKANDITGKVPCSILVDVNGDKKPTPGNINCKDSTCGAKDNIYKVPLPSEKKVRDIFAILITEEKAIPYGVTAQKAMYQAQK